MGGTAMSGESDPNRLPGARLYRLFQAACADQTLDVLVEPTLADLQHEVAVAGQSRGRRWTAYVRGYLGLCRVWCVHLMTGRMSMRRWGTVLMLGVIGAALLVVASSLQGDLLSRVGKIGVAPFFLMAIATPVVLRKLRLGTGFRQMFISCATVGTTMGGVFMTWVRYVSLPQPVPWSIVAIRFAILLGCVLFGSALAAAVGAARAGEGHSRFRLAMRGPVWGAAAFGTAYTVLQSRGLVLGGRPLSIAIGIQVVLAILSWAALLGFFFSAIAATVYYPLILASRRITAWHLWPSAIGALLFPVPWEIYALVKGDPHLHLLRMLELNSLTTVVPLLLPLVIGGAVFGWVLAHGDQSPDAVLHPDGAATV